MHPINISGESVSQYTSYSLNFSPLRSVVNRENNTKSISSIKPAITENMECMIVKVHAPVIDIKVGVSP